VFNKEEGRESLVSFPRLSEAGNQPFILNITFMEQIGVRSCM